MPANPIRPAAVVLLALSTAGCSSPLLSLGGALADAAFANGRGERGQLVAEVVEIDELQRRIRVTTEDGRTGSVLYDQNTLVVADDQRHVTVRALAPGDRILVQVEQDQNRNLYAIRIDLQPREPEPAAPETPEPVPPDPTRRDAAPAPAEPSGPLAPA
jgi:hypothetical protein